MHEEILSALTVYVTPTNRKGTDIYDEMQRMYHRTNLINILKNRMD